MLQASADFMSRPILELVGGKRSYADTHFCGRGRDRDVAASSV